MSSSNATSALAKPQPALPVPGANAPGNSSNSASSTVPPPPERPKRSNLRRRLSNTSHVSGVSTADSLATSLAASENAPFDQIDGRSFVSSSTNMSKSSGYITGSRGSLAPSVAPSNGSNNDLNSGESDESLPSVSIASTLTALRSSNRNVASTNLPHVPQTSAGAPASSSSSSPSSANKGSSQQLQQHSQQQGSQQGTSSIVSSSGMLSNMDGDELDRMVAAALERAGVGKRSEPSETDRESMTTGDDESVATTNDDRSSRGDMSTAKQEDAYLQSYTDVLKRDRNRMRRSVYGGSRPVSFIATADGGDLGFEIMSAQDEQEAKKEEEIIAYRIRDFETKLRLEQQMREGALQLIRLHKGNKRVKKETEEKVEETTKRIEILALELCKLGKSHMDITRDLLRSENAKLRQSLAQSKLEASRATQANHSLTVAKERAESRLRQAESDRLELIKLEQEKSSLEAKVNELTQEAQKLRVTLQESESRLEEQLQRVTKELEGEVDGLRSKGSMLDMRNKDLENKVSIMEEERDHLLHKIGSMDHLATPAFSSSSASSSSSSVDSSNKSSGAHSKANEGSGSGASSTRTTALEAHLAAAEKAQARAETQITVLEEEVAQLKRTLEVERKASLTQQAELNRARRQIQEAAGDGAQKARVQELEEKVKQFEAERAAHVAEVKKLNELIKTVTLDREQALLNLDAEREEVELLRRELEEEQDLNRKKMQTLNLLNSQIDELNSQLDETESLHDAKALQARQLTTDLEKMQRELREAKDALRRESDMTASVKQALTESLREIILEKERLTLTVTQLKSDIELSKRSRVDLETKLASIREQNERLEGDLTQSQVKIQTLDVQLAAERARSSLLSDELVREAAERLQLQENLGKLSSAAAAAAVGSASAIGAGGAGGGRADSQRGKLNRNEPPQGDSSQIGAGVAGDPQTPEAGENDLSHVDQDSAAAAASLAALLESEKERVARLETQLAELKQERSRLDQSLAQVTAELEAMVQEKQRLASSLSAVKSELESERNRFETSDQERWTQIHQLESRVQELQLGQDRSKVELQRAQADLIAAEAEKASAVARLTKSIREFEMKAGEIEAGRHSAENRCQELTARLAIVEAEAARARMISQDIENAKLSSQQELDSLRAEVTKAEGQLANERESAARRLQEATVRQQLAETERSRISAEAENLRQEVARLQNRVAQQEADLIAASAALLAATAAASNSSSFSHAGDRHGGGSGGDQKQQQQQQQQQHQQQQQNLQQLQQFKQQIKDLEMALQQMQEKYAMAAEERARTTVDLQSSMAREANLQEDLDRMRQDLDRMTKTWTDFDAVRTRMQSVIDEDREKIRQLQEEVQELTVANIAAGAVSQSSATAKDRAVMAHLKEEFRRVLNELRREYNLALSKEISDRTRAENEIRHLKEERERSLSGKVTISTQTHMLAY